MAEPKLLNPLDYPFDIPGFEYLWTAGAVLGIEAWDPSEKANRTPVLAIGSNGSPQQLDTKFPRERWRPAEPRENDIPVEIVTAFDVDVVFCAHVSIRGRYIPVTMLSTPGPEVIVRMLWLTKGQLEAMDRSEGYGSEDLNSAYWRRRVPRVEHHGEVVPGVECYISTRGAALFGDEPFGLRSVDALRSPIVQRGYQRDAWARLAAELGRPPGTDLCELARDHRVRSEISAYFEDHRLPPALSGTAGP